MPNLLEVLFRLLGSLSCVFELSVGRLKSTFNFWEPLDGMHVWCHLVELGVESVDFLMKFILELFVGVLREHISAVTFAIYHRHTHFFEIVIQSIEVDLNTVILHDR